MCCGPKRLFFEMPTARLESRRSSFASSSTLSCPWPWPYLPRAQPRPAKTLPAAYVPALGRTQRFALITRLSETDNLTGMRCHATTYDFVALGWTAIRRILSPMIPRLVSCSDIPWIDQFTSVVWDAGRGWGRKRKPCDV